MSFLVSTIMFLSPLLFFEYQRVRHWWASTTSRMARRDNGVPSSSERAQGDFAMALLCADVEDRRSRSAVHACFLWDPASLSQHVWILLLETITVLESSIPAARCATVACAAADLANDTLGLFDLALEVRKRGFLGGMWLFVNDAFHYHYKKELERRGLESCDANGEREHAGRAEDCENPGGKYTVAVASAVENFRKVAHNVSCLIKIKNGADGELSRNDSDRDNVPIESRDMKGVGESLNQDDNHFDKRQSTEDELKIDVSRNSCESDKCMSSSVNFDHTNLAPSNDDLERRDASPEKDETQGGEGNVLAPAVIGGLALVSAVAGMAMHAANSSYEPDRRQKGQTPAR